MKQRSILQFNFRLIVVLALAVICWQSAFTSARAVVTETPHSISQLSWMTGDWQTVGKTKIEEHWMAPAGGTMIGMGRTLRGDRTTEFEFLRIQERDGEIYYVANPLGLCPATDFKLTKLTSDQVVFENPQHDFPKRVSYRKNSDGSLTATVDGGPGTKANTFAYRAMARK